MPTNHISRIVGFLMDFFGVAGNVVLTIVCLWAAHRLWGTSQIYLDYSGGLPEFSMTYVVALVQTPELHTRLMYWGISWASFVFSVGFLLLGIAGVHWAWKAIRQNLETAW